MRPAVSYLRRIGPLGRRIRFITRKTNVGNAGPGGLAARTDLYGERPIGIDPRSADRCLIRPARPAQVIQQAPHVGPRTTLPITENPLTAFLALAEYIPFLPLVSGSVWLIMHLWTALGPEISRVYT